MKQAGKVFLLALAAILIFSQKQTQAESPLSDEAIKNAFAKESLTLTNEQAASIRPHAASAYEAHCSKSPTGGNSKIGFAAVQIASQLGINTKIDQSAVARITNALKQIPCTPPGCDRADGCRAKPSLAWDEYFSKTVNLTANSEFLKLLGERSFSPVKISWEDIGRYENSVWGDRISDVGIWVRRVESDPNSAELALSVRRDSNFRDKVLVVPADKIKIHIKENNETRELSLPERLKQLELTSSHHDQNVIVSNQFAIVPVPARDMAEGSSGDHPPRAAFTFSIYPYGSTNFVITDVIEGSSDAVVGPGNHQLLFANVEGKKAPFTASRAAERQDLLKLESELKAKGMDVDVQRYYLIQIPLRREQGIGLANMGTPPQRRMYLGGMSGAAADGVMYEAFSVVPNPAQLKRGLDKVAIGHGEIEGDYNVGSAYQGRRAEEPMRVTVVYFVTPIAEVTRKDMDAFAEAFSGWDNQAI